MNELVLDALKTIKKYNMIEKNDKVLIGVSGGPDSVALLYLLNEIKDEFNLFLSIAHLNHQIRKNSIKDENYVKRIAKELNIPFYCKRIKIIPQKGESLEQTARKVRYEFFLKAAKENKCNKIALGHTLDDNIETILMWLIRGSGTHGICGIPHTLSINGVKIIRPLIEQTKEKIIKYLKEIKKRPKIDYTNFSSEYLRNRIRNQLIPYLKKLNPNIKEVIAKFSKILSDENEFISNIIKSDYSHILKKKNRTVEIDVKKMKKMHVAIKRRIIRDAICYVKGDLQGIGFTHIEYILSNLEPIHPLTIDLPHNIQVKNRYGKIIISKKIEFQKLNKVKLPIPGNTQINNLYISTNSCDGKIKLLNNPKSGIFLDLEKVSLPLYIRGRKNGDRIYIKNLGTKKVSDLFIDKKVPKEERDSIPFLVDRNDKILWIVGFYINKFYLAKKRSKKVLQIRIRNL